VTSTLVGLDALLERNLMHAEALIKTDELWGDLQALSEGLKNLGDVPIHDVETAIVLMRRIVLGLGSRDVPKEKCSVVDTILCSIRAVLDQEPFLGISRVAGAFLRFNCSQICPARVGVFDWAGGDVHRYKVLKHTPKSLIFEEPLPIDIPDSGTVIYTTKDLTALRYTGYLDTEMFLESPPSNSPGLATIPLLLERYDKIPGEVIRVIPLLVTTRVSNSRRPLVIRVRDRRIRSIAMEGDVTEMGLDVPLTFERDI
jgi:hypothetical protein